VHIIVASGTMVLPLGAFLPYCREGPHWFAEPGRSEEKGWMLAVDSDPRMCEVFSVGARQRTGGCSPRCLGEVLALVQGL